MSVIEEWEQLHDLPQHSILAVLAPDDTFWLAVTCGTVTVHESRFQVRWLSEQRRGGRRRHSKDKLFVVDENWLPTLIWRDSVLIDLSASTEIDENNMWVIPNVILEQLQATVCKYSDSQTEPTTVQTVANTLIEQHSLAPPSEDTFSEISSKCANALTQVRIFGIIIGHMSISVLLTHHDSFLVHQIRLCRSQMTGSLWKAMLGWEHKVLKSYAKHLAKKGGLAIGIGKEVCVNGESMCYLRTLECGNLSNLSSTIPRRSMYRFSVVHDVIACSSDLERLCAVTTSQRSKLQDDLLRSFHKFVNECIVHNIFVYVCLSNASGEITLQTHGLQSNQQLLLRTAIESTIRVPPTHTFSFDASVLSRLPDSLDTLDQFQVVNSIPAQCFKQRTKEGSLGIALPLHLLQST